jgi:alkylhydroperoxidase/carboxymuconolactone decarboxylase family protein YurZ
MARKSVGSYSAAPGVVAPRDRSLVTVSTLIASGQSAQVTYHLSRAMDDGVTKAEASEVVTHLAFYAGWPNVFSALPVVKAVFEKRPNSPGGGITVPHVIVKLWPGKSEHQKRSLPAGSSRTSWRFCVTAKNPFC